MIDVHQNGWTKTIYDKEECNLYQKTMFYTFEDRFIAVRDLLAVRVVFDTWFRAC
jgi:hypothetical protein